MNTTKEEKFKETIKSLVHDEPEKLAFYKDLGPSSAIPLFVPSEKSTEETKYLSVRTKKRRYAFGMAAAAACFVVFISIAIIGLAPGANTYVAESSALNRLEAGYGSGGSAGTAKDTAAPEAPAAGATSEESITTMQDAPSAEILSEEDAPAMQKAPATGNPSEDGGMIAREAAAEILYDDGGMTAQETPAEINHLAVSPAGTGGRYNIALIIAVVFAALFVVLLIKRRKLR